MELIRTNFTSIVCGLFVLVCLLELIRPANKSPSSILRVWSLNFSILIVNAGLGRLILLIIGVSHATDITQWGLGLFPALQLPAVVSVVLSLLILDIKEYLRHRAFHSWTPLWRIHQMHHAPAQIDVTSGWFFHPLEALLTLCIDLLLILLLGISPEAYLVYSLTVYSFDFWTHANLKLSPMLERILGLLFNTPGLHRTHHSMDVANTNCNFGFALSIWDRMFGTLNHEAAEGRYPLQFGIREITPKTRSALDYLRLPFNASVAATVQSATQTVDKTAE